jgi:hypothetical protein
MKNKNIEKLYELFQQKRKQQDEKDNLEYEKLIAKVEQNTENVYSFIIEKLNHFLDNDVDPWFENDEKEYLLTTIDKSLFFVNGVFDEKSHDEIINFANRDFDEESYNGIVAEVHQRFFAEEEKYYPFYFSITKENEVFLGQYGTDRHDDMIKKSIIGQKFYDLRDKQKNEREAFRKKIKEQELLELNDAYAKFEDGIEKIIQNINLENPAEIYVTTMPKKLFNKLITRFYDENNIGFGLFFKEEQDQTNEENIVLKFRLI